MAKKKAEVRKPFRPDKTIKVKKFAPYKDTYVLCNINVFENGVAFFDTRQFQDELPTKGISIHADHLLEYQKIVNKAVRMMRKRGLIKDE